MNNWMEDLRERFRGPFDEDRVWMSTYSTHDDMPLGDVEETVTEHAESIENTLGCVTHVRPVQHGMGGCKDIALVVVMPRSADKDTFDNAMQGIQHQIHDDLINKL